MNFRVHHAVLVIVFFSFSHSSIAHHAITPHFDSKRTVEFTGVISEFKLVNPHAYIYVDVADDKGGLVTWNCEMNAASTMRRFGWSQELFPIGAEISVEGWAAHRDGLGCAFQKGTLADGTVVLRSGDIALPNQTEVAAQQSSSAKEIDMDLKTISGNWITTRPSGPPTGFGPWTRMEELSAKLTTAGLEASNHYDIRFDDPALQCSPSSIVRAWSEIDGVSEITLTDEQVVIRHAYMDTERVIDLTLDSHPDVIQPTLTGHSIGRFEGDKLVVETVGFTPGVLAPHPGILNSDKLRIIETISLVEGGTHLQNAVEIVDDSFFNEPLQSLGYWARTNEPLTEYNCVELSGKNNERPDE